jgi:hypothetical protein
MPALPVSQEALVLALNGATIWFIMPEALRPSFRGWYRYATVMMLGINLVLAGMSLGRWLR